jgi:hypothetical protein
VADQFGRLEGTIDRGQAARLRLEVAALAAGRTSGPRRLAGRQFPQVPLLHLPAQLAAQLVGGQLDHRVVRHPLDRAVGPLQGHRGLGRFGHQPGQLLPQFFLHFLHSAFHGDPPKQAPLLAKPPTTPPIYRPQPKSSY